MALIERFNRFRAISKIGEYSEDLAKELEGHPLKTIQLARDTLKKAETERHNSRGLASLLHDGLERKAFNDQNLIQILLVLQQTTIAGHNANNLVGTLRDGLESKVFNAENLPGVLELVSHHAAKGKNPFVFAATLQTLHLPLTSENLKAVKDAEPHILRIYDFLHSVHRFKDQKKVFAPLFSQLLKTYKTELPKMGEKRYWQWIGLYAKQLKANKTNLKPA